MPSYKEYKPQQYLTPGSAINNLLQPVDYGKVYDVLAQLEQREGQEVDNALKQDALDTKKKVKSGLSNLPDDANKMQALENLLLEAGDVQNYLDVVKMNGGDDPLDVMKTLGLYGEQFPEFTAQKAASSGLGKFVGKGKDPRILSGKHGIFSIDPSTNEVTTLKSFPGGSGNKRLERVIQGYRELPDGSLVNWKGTVGEYEADPSITTDLDPGQKFKMTMDALSPNKEPPAKKDALTKGEVSLSQIIEDAGKRVAGYVDPSNYVKEASKPITPIKIPKPGDKIHILKKKKKSDKKD